MPVYPCVNPHCTEYVPRRGDGCPDHAPQSQAPRREYDRRRDPRAKQFYNSKPWKLTRTAKLATDPVCEACGAAWAAHVHHHKPLLSHWHLRLTMSNLRAVCIPCHNALEAEVEQEGSSHVHKDA